MTPLKIALLNSSQNVEKSQESELQLIEKVIQKDFAILNLQTQLELKLQLPKMEKN